MNETATPASAWWIFPVVVLGFLVFWPLLCLLIAKLGGWAGVAKRYAARRWPEGAHFTGQSLQIAPATNYGGCVRVTFSREGLWLAPIWLFRLGHRPLLIPWDLVGAPVERRVLGVRQVYLPIQAGRRLLRLGLSRKAQRWLRGEEDCGSWRPTLRAS
jgi:hypothetical protein